MKVEEKMRLCFNDELENNEVLTDEEKKVLAGLMYSYKVTKDAKNGELIRSMPKVIKDSGIKSEKVYEALRNLELLYGMVERIPGERRTKGEPSKASIFKLHFDKILNPPKEIKKFDFTEELKSSEKPMGKANIKANTNINSKSNSNINSKSNSNSNINTNSNSTGIYNTEVKNKFKLLEEFVNKQFDNCKTYKESVSQISSIYDWIHERYSDGSNVEPLTDYANKLINKKLSVYSSPVNTVTTETVQVEDDGLPF